MKPSDVVLNAPHFCQPLVLGALPMKSELLAEVQGVAHAKVYETIAVQWAEVVRAVEDATELVVAGYGFLPEDDYGRFLLREAVKRRKKVPLPITYYSRPEDRGKVEAAMREVFGNEVNYTFAGRVEAPVPPA